MSPEASVLERKQKVWKCTECGKEFSNIPPTCECGALAPTFIEKTIAVGENNERKDYLVLKNIIYEGFQYNAGVVINLVVEDRVTKDMVVRGLVKEVEPRQVLPEKGKKREVQNEEFEVVSRKAENKLKLGGKEKVERGVDMAELILGSSGDVREELGNPSEIEYSATVLNLARTRATRVVTGYVEKAYPGKTPFTSSGDVPVLLNEITNELAVFYAKRLNHPGPNPLSEEVKEEYWDKPMEMLKGINEGTIVLSELSTEQGDDIIAKRSEYTPIYDVDEIEKQVVDSDLKGDIEDERD